MPLVTVESWEKETRTSAKNKEYECVVFYGTKHGYDGAPDEPWEKPMVPWADGEWIKEIQSYGTGAKLLIRNEKEGKHWRIVSIEPWGDTKKQDTEPDDASPSPSVPNVPVVTQGLIASNSVMGDCMGNAVALVKGMMDNAETFKSMIKKSAGTELVIQLTKDIANQLYREVKNKEDGIESNSSEVDPESDPVEKEVEVPMD